MAYEIEKNKPIPSARTKYPFWQMEVGDSFTVLPNDPGAVRTSPHASPRAMAAAYTWGKLNGKTFTMRTNSDKGFTIWRIK